jgi:hypothetical protein
MNGVAIKDMTGAQLRDAAKLIGLTGVSKLKVDVLRERVRVAFQSAPLPLMNSQRLDNYTNQNGADKLTPAQRRRSVKKLLKNGK